MRWLCNHLFQLALMSINKKFWFFMISNDESSDDRCRLACELDVRGTQLTAICVSPTRHILASALRVVEFSSVFFMHRDYTFCTCTNASLKLGMTLNGMNRVNRRQFASGWHYPLRQSAQKSFIHERRCREDGRHIRNEIKEKAQQV